MILELATMVFLKCRRATKQEVGGAHYIGLPISGRWNPFSRASGSTAAPGGTTAGDFCAAVKAEH